MAKPSGKYIPLGGFVFSWGILRFPYPQVSAMTQERFSRFVFSAALIAVTAYWLWFLFAHADQIFRH
jgi:hypothetical protein